MRSGSRRSRSSRRASSAGGGVARYRRQRDVAASRGPWSPRWFWPSFAGPATLFLLVFFLFPFYVVLAITFGGTDPILRQPLPALDPLRWRTGVLSFTFS